MNKTTFGKTKEYLKKRIIVRLVNNAKDYKKYVSRPSFISQKISNKNFVAIHEIKPVLALDKPIYAGFSVLDLSKLLMYEFHYKNIKKNVELIYCLQIHTVYPANKKVIGKMKDDFKGEIISEFVGLMLQMHSFIVVDGEKVKKAKGVNKNVVKNMRHKESVDALFNKKNNET